MVSNRSIRYSVTSVARTLGLTVCAKLPVSSSRLSRKQSYIKFETYKKTSVRHGLVAERMFVLGTLFWLEGGTIQPACGFFS